MIQIDTAGALRDALAVLSRAEIDRAWGVGEAAHKELGGNLALRAELAAYVLGS